MSDWKPESYSDSSTPVEIDPKLLEEEVVIMMRGKNVFGDKIFSYVKLTLRNLQKMKDAMSGDGTFMPSDFGTVLAAGKGEPSSELRAEMAITYNMIDVPNAPTADAPPPPPAPPSGSQGLWDE